LWKRTNHSSLLAWSSDVLNASSDWIDSVEHWRHSCSVWLKCTNEQTNEAGIACALGVFLVRNGTRQTSTCARALPQTPRRLRMLVALSVSAPAVRVPQPFLSRPIGQFLHFTVHNDTPRHQLFWGSVRSEMSRRRGQVPSVAFLFCARRLHTFSFPRRWATTRKKRTVAFASRRLVDTIKPKEQTGHTYNHSNKNQSS